MPLASLWMSFIATKLGQAKRTLAARLPRYLVDPLHHVPIVKGSQKLRGVIFGEGDTMPSERDIKLRRTEHHDASRASRR